MLEHHPPLVVSSGVVSVPAQIGRGIVVALGFVGVTWGFFGPIAGWHHIILCGILAPVVLTAEDAHVPGRPRWGDFDVVIHGNRLLFSVVLWLVAVVVVILLSRRIGRDRTPQSKG